MRRLARNGGFPENRSDCSGSGLGKRVLFLYFCGLSHIGTECRFHAQERMSTTASIPGRTQVGARSTLLLIAVCFFLSGAAGLIYEVVWARQLGLFLGITSHAHTAVIAAYMAGMAAGSVYFGRLADRHARPLVVYAWLEIGVGVYAAITPALFPFLQKAYANVADVAGISAAGGQLDRFAIALLALFLPTFLMGGTLPLLVRGLTASLPELGRMTSRLYGINTLGAMLGTVLAGFMLLPGVGVMGTVFVGVGINLGIAFFVLRLSRRPGSARPVVEPVARPVMNAGVHAGPAGQPLSRGARRMVLLAFGTAGFAALLTQLAWIRAMILVVGGSVYAFTITLASFLCGIGLGSLLYARHLAVAPVRAAPSMLRNHMVQAALLAVLTSLTLLLGLPLIGKLPGWFFAGYLAGLKDHFQLFQLFIFTLSFSVMILPTLLMGALFPLVTVIWTPGIERAGRGVGSAYAINTGGTILGALLGGLLILPWLGIHDSLKLAAALYFLVALGFWMFSSAGAGRSYRYAVAAMAACALLAAAWLVPAWDKLMMTSGVFHQPEGIERAMQQQPGAGLDQVIDDYELLYYEEGPDATVAVRRMRGSADNQRTLVINGKPDASSYGDLSTQVLLAQLPLALMPRASSALVIGLGSGITAGSLAASEELEEMTVLEISAQVVEASEFFALENHQVLDDPRVNLVTADARNYLMASPARYDLIVSEPSNPWVSGVANLFTLEFLQLAKSRLQPGGIMTQWFHTYGMSEADLKTMLKTFDDNFDYVNVWQLGPGDLALVGSDSPHGLSLEHVLGAGVGELARAQVRNGRDLVALYVFGGDVLSDYVRGARVNSDGAPVVEFNAPRNLYRVTEFENMDRIAAFIGDRQQTVPFVDMVTRGDGRLRAPFLFLELVGQGDGPSGFRADWIIDRPRVVGVEVPGPASQRLLTWREGEAEFQIRAVFLDEAKPGQDLDALLALLRDRTGRQGGRIRLADGTAAIWLVDIGNGSSPMELDLAWDCEVPAGMSSRYAMNLRLPGTDQGGWRQALENVAGRIRCAAAGRTMRD
ncbi:MAG: fused MFS/spermidine synthase [Chromatiales bacterium]|nr:fused MFS/spermidine synthase [Chromatiales bacterium]